MSLATIDFSRLVSSDQVERSKLSKALVVSLKDHGAVKLVNFGVTDTVINRFLKLAVDYFAISHEGKMQAVNDGGPNPQRGYCFVGQEQLSRLLEDNVNGHAGWSELRDAHEHFDMGPPGDVQFPNKWPSETYFPDFRPMMESIWHEFQSAAMQLANAIEEGLELPEGTITLRCQPSGSEMRLNHYPEISVETLSQGKTKRIWPHGDLGIISLLFQDQVGGLEVEDRTVLSPSEKAFMSVAPAGSDCSPEVIVLVAETLERWTNGIMKKCIHQVSPPLLMKHDSQAVCPERYSSAFFLKADKSTSVAPLPELVKEGQPTAYDDLTALEFQQRRVARLY